MKLVNIPFSYMWTLRHLCGDCQTVLDIGTADGALMEAIRRDSWDIVGIDIYKPWIKQAKGRKIYKKIYEGDLIKICSQLVKSKHKFDLVFCSQTIEHIGQRDGIQLLNLAEKLATKKILIGTPKGFMNQPEEYIGENDYQRHKSGWEIEDFSKRGYRLYGVGASIIWSEDGLARKHMKYVSKLLNLLSYILAPIVYFQPRLAAGIIAIKDKNEK